MQRTRINNNNELYQYTLSFSELSVDRRRIYKILGYPKGDLPENTQEMLEDIFKRASEMCHIRGGVRFLNYIVQPDTTVLKVNGTSFSVGRIVGRQLKGSESVALFICTIGDGLEKWSNQLMKEADYLNSYIIDAVASTTVEAAINIIHEDIRGVCQKHGLRITNRFSPGYCDWHVSDQQHLFSFFPSGFCDIHLKESSLMIPIKSVSGIIGIGHDVDESDYPCEFCDRLDCVYRKTGEPV